MENDGGGLGVIKDAYCQSDKQFKGQCEGGDGQEERLRLAGGVCRGGLRFFDGAGGRRSDKSGARPEDGEPDLKGH